MSLKKLLFVIALVGFSLNLPTVSTTSQSVFAQSRITSAAIQVEACDCSRPSCSTCFGNEPAIALAPISPDCTLDTSHLAPVLIQNDNDYSHGSGCGCNETTNAPSCSSCQTGGCRTGGCRTGGCRTGGCQAGGCQRCRTPRKRGCRKCPKCLNDVCTLKVEKGKEKKSTYETEQKIICIPKVRLPWQNCNPCNPAPTCSETRTVTLLKKKSYECDVCKYTWSVAEPEVPDVSHLEEPEVEEPEVAPESEEAEAGSVQPDGSLPFENNGSEDGPQEPIIPGGVPEAPPIPKTSGRRYKIFK